MNKEKLMYFWDSSQVLSHPPACLHKESPLRGLPCYANNSEFSTPDTLIWGIYNKPEGWTPVPKEQMPPEFLTSLLIMGVL